MHYLAVLIMDNSPGSIYDIISKGGVPALLFVILYGGFKKDPWWVFGWTYRELLERTGAIQKTSEEWKGLALSSTNLASQFAEMQKSKVHED